MIVNAGQLDDLAPDPNANLFATSTFFTTGEGPGIVNAPVAPDAVYVMRFGATPGLSVLDLNGFGAGTGNPTFDRDNPQPGNTNFPNNPNIQPGQIPPLSVGTCTVDGGSAGVFTLTRDSSLENLVVRPPLLSSLGDVIIGHALDTSFHNGPAPFGCQAGIGNICAQTLLKRSTPVPNGNTVIEGLPTPQTPTRIAFENIISWAPHPNPPPLTFPPLCITPFLGAQEPTSVNSPLPQLLGPGDPFGNPLASPPRPPSGLLTPEQNVSPFELGSLQNLVPDAQCVQHRERRVLVFVGGIRHPDRAPVCEKRGSPQAAFASRHSSSERAASSACTRCSP
ncbi:MAG: hypothetical protein GY711_08225 [bacterium]|nr:hypothetical protein [bacterium]